MKKIRTSFALSPDTIYYLKQLAELDNRSQASMLEQVIKAAAEKAKIKPPQKP